MAHKRLNGKGMLNSLTTLNDTAAEALAEVNRYKEMHKQLGYIPEDEDAPTQHGQEVAERVKQTGFGGGYARSVTPPASVYAVPGGNDGEIVDTDLIRQIEGS